MKKVLLCLAAILVVSGLASAASLCAFTPDVTGMTCEIGGLTFSDFMVLPAAGNPTPVISLVSADVTGGTVNLTFNPNISAPPSGGPEDIHFYFTVTGGVDQVDLSTGGTNATIGERVCSAPIPSTGANANLCPDDSFLASIVAYSFPPGPNTAISGVFNTTDTLYVYKDIGVLPNTPVSGGGFLTNFTQSFHQIPEPMSMILMGSGLLGVGLLRKKVRA